MKTKAGKYNCLNRDEWDDCDDQDAVNPLSCASYYVSSLFFSPVTTHQSPLYQSFMYWADKFTSMKIATKTPRHQGSPRAFIIKKQVNWCIVSWLFIVSGHGRSSHHEELL
jgi:hypothetical protein